MKRDAKLGHSFEQVDAAEEKAPSILLYSPDMDFCMSLRLLFQNRYTVRTTTDPQMLLLMMREFDPQLAIVDGLPTARMKRWLERIREESSHVRIMFFYVPRFNDRDTRDYIRNAVDAAFAKPVDLTEVTHRIEELIEVGP